MSDENRAYYKPAGRSLAAVTKLLGERREVLTKICAFCKRYGTNQYQAGGFGHFHGLIFDDPSKAPTGWKARKRSPNVFTPNTRTCEGKAIEKEMNELRMPLAERDGIGAAKLDGGYLYFPAIEAFGDEPIISLHKDATPPPDAIPLKRSEYWAMREADETKKASK